MSKRHNVVARPEDNHFTEELVKKLNVLALGNANEVLSKYLNIKHAVEQSEDVQMSAPDLMLPNMNKFVIQKFLLRLKEAQEQKQARNNILIYGAGILCFAF